MLYSIVGTDNEDSLEARVASRPDHVARLIELKNLGHLIMAGPNPAIDNPEPGEAGFTGSIIVAEFESLDAANRWASEDPYLLNGVYKSVEVKPFNKVLP
jgi:uncharacterized protein YciI